MIRSQSAAPVRLRDAWLALAGLSAVFLFEMLDNSILTIALPTIGRETHASASALQWVTSSYAVVFGGLMLVFGAVADRVGRRRVMLIGLVLLGLASLATAFVSTAGELIAVRAAMGVASAMTTPGSIALAFRLFRDDDTRVRGMNLITTVGLIGMAIAPTAGGLVLAIAPWQVLLLVNVPVAALAVVGVRLGIPRDDPAELHPHPLDLAGGALGTATIALALIAPTLFVEQGAGSWAAWAVTAGALIALAAFVMRERRAAHPLLDLALIARPLVSSGLAFKAASGLAIAGLGYLVTLQLQLDWGWPPALAAIGMLPQVVVLVAGGAVLTPFVRRVGLDRAAVISASSMVLGLAVYAALGRFSYLAVAAAVVLVAAGLRIVGVVAGTNVLRGLPENRTTIGAALVDTASQIATGVGLALAGTILAAVFPGSLTAGSWTAAQHSAFETAVTLGGGGLTLLAGALVLAGFLRARRGGAAAGADSDAAESVSPASVSPESVSPESVNS